MLKMFNKCLKTGNLWEFFLEKRTMWKCETHISNIFRGTLWDYQIINNVAFVSFCKIKI